jgi:glycosyltransferase involved in cell wall biosynthesis
MRPKVIILSAFLSPFRSGAEACVEEVSLRLCSRYDLTIITARLRRDLPKHDRLRGVVPIVRVGLGCSFDKWLFPFLAPFTARGKHPQLIHALLETFAGLALFFCQWLVPSAKRLLTLQTTNRSFLKWLVLRPPHSMTAISRTLQEIASSLGRSDVTVIPNGIDYPAIRAACGRHPKVPGRILFVGRLRPMKGVDTLLRAFAKLPAPQPSPRLRLAGSGELPASLRIVGDGELRSRLEHLAHDLGIADRVTFTGYVPIPKVYEEFAQAEIFCSLSRHEALGNVFLEAQAAGCAVLGTAIEGIPEVVLDGQTGILIPCDDIHGARRALESLLRSSSLREKLSSAAVLHAKQYDWGVIAERYERLYAQFVAEVPQGLPQALRSSSLC